MSGASRARPRPRGLCVDRLRSRAAPATLARSKTSPGQYRRTAARARARAARSRARAFSPQATISAHVYHEIRNVVGAVLALAERVSESVELALEENEARSKAGSKSKELKVAAVF